jgi:hypothetical protein
MFPSLVDLSSELQRNDHTEMIRALGFLYG